MPTIAIAGNRKARLFCWPAGPVSGRLGLLCPTDSLNCGEQKRSQNGQAFQRSRIQNEQFTELLTLC